ncbi:hypothetical protein [Hydrogenimonas sp. SS33]|uniref:hypothetical protein n=1 Tax=Hydrogenimonas leucolamina TaxID=2954236 RepID=UPI00336C007F
MKRWCRLLLPMFFCATMLHAGGRPLQKLPPAQVKKELAAIAPLAITYGHGPKIIDLFVDPRCSVSRRFMHFIFGKPAMAKRYTYRIYLDELPRLKSRHLIAYIYSQPNPLNALKRVMLENETPDDAKDFEPDEAVERGMEAIEKTGKEIGVFKRPYIIYNGKAK